jgi:hypothetical protein
MAENTTPEGLELAMCRRGHLSCGLRIEKCKCAAPVYRKMSVADRGTQVESTVHGGRPELTGRRADLVGVQTTIGLQALGLENLP